MILQLNDKGEQIGEPFKSIRAAARAMGVHKNSITKVVDKPDRKSCGYFWKYKSDNTIPTTQVETIGIGTKEFHDFEKDILPYLKNIGERAKEKNESQGHQQIKISGDAFAIVMLSDIHGGAKSDYAQIEHDIKIIRDTPDMYCILAGDLTDNFIIGKLQALQKFQSTTFDDEMRFLEWMINILEGSLIAFVSGNHDNWTKKIAAYDILKKLLKNTPCLFDNNEVRFKLKGDHFSEDWLIRHKMKWSSIFNPTHGGEVMWERGEKPFDVVLSGHTHIASLYREFIKHDVKRASILLGTYKLRDEYQVECGFGKTHSNSRGSGALVYDSNGNRHWCDNVIEAVKYLDYLKK
jgi:predicted MPP superfamily phosphohydrolase